MLKNRYAYIAIFTYEKDGISIEFPDLPGCLPSAPKGDTVAAFQNAKEALGLHIWGIEQDEEEAPVPCELSALKLESNQTATLIEVFMPPIRERVKTKFVKKTLSLPAWLAARADEDGVNCSRLFQQALMEYLGVSHS